MKTLHVILAVLAVACSAYLAGTAAWRAPLYAACGRRGRACLWVLLAGAWAGITGMNVDYLLTALR
jgi:hypothetical protein